MATDGSSPVAIAFDGDLGARPDALLAVALLNGLTVQGAARRIGLTVSAASLTAARLADVLAELYPARPLREGREVIGVPDARRPQPDAPALARLLAAKGPGGASPYESAVRGWVDTADSAVLLRNRLLGEHDGSIAIVLAGPATGLLRLLALPGARPQIEAKVKLLVLAAGEYPSGPAEASVVRDVAAARRLLAEWPTPVVAVGAEVGRAVLLPRGALEAGLSWLPAHPIPAACTALAPAASSYSTCALAAVLHAAERGASSLRTSPPGTLRVLDDGSTRFLPSASGRHHYLSVEPGQRTALLAELTGLVFAQPAERPRRVRPGGAP